MENAKTLLEALQEIRDPLTFWAFLSVVALFALYAFLRSTKFHGIWSSTLGSLLSAAQAFRLAKYFLLGAFILLILIVIAAATAPLILQKLRVETKKIEASVLSNKESIATRELFERALNTFREEKNYRQAREDFRSVRRRVTTDHSRDVVDGLITASFYGEGRHREGLSYICELYRVRPLDSIRYRFDIHAHIRRIAIEDGFNVAEDVAVEFATQCGRTDFSPVWAGIPLAKMEYLKKGATVFEEYFNLSWRDVEYLQGIIENYPIDAFLDHAHYFMLQFDKVIGTDSTIEDMAILAAVQLDPRIKLGYGPDYEEKYYKEALRRIFLMKYYIDKFPDSGRSGDVKSHLISMLLRSGSLSEGLDSALSDGRNVEQHIPDIIHGLRSSVKRFGLHETLQMSIKYGFFPIFLSHVHDGDLDVHAESVEHGFSEWYRVSGERSYMERHFDDIWDFFEFSDLRTVFSSFQSFGLIYAIEAKIDFLWKRYLDNVGFELLHTGDIQGALEEYKSQKMAIAKFGLSIPKLLIDRIYYLDGIIIADMQSDSEVHLEAAIRLRDMGAESLAVQRFEAIANDFEDPMVAQKALYLQGATLRRMKEYAAAKEVFGRLWSRFPDGHLADDSLAELGWYYLMVEFERDAAHEYFNRVLELYPGRNATDNALNWLGWSNLKAKNYSEALTYYLKLVETYTTSRLGARAKRTIEILEKVILTRRTELQLKDVVVSGNFVMFVMGEGLPFRFGDRIVEIDGYSVVDGRTLRVAIGSVREGYVDVTILRGVSRDRFRFRVPVEMVEVYDEYARVRRSM